MGTTTKERVIMAPRKSKGGRPSTSGYKGVYNKFGGWTAMVMVAGKQKQLGTFASPEIAAICRAEYLGDQAMVDRLRGYLDRPTVERPTRTGMTSVAMRRQISIYQPAF